MSPFYPPFPARTPTANSALGTRYHWRRFRRTSRAPNVPDEVIEELGRHFDHAQRVELTVTAAFYAMVPRILDALRVPVESKQPDRELPRPAGGPANGRPPGR